MTVEPQELQDFLDFMNSGKQVTAECGVHQTMHRLSQEAIRITKRIKLKLDGMSPVEYRLIAA